MNAEANPAASADQMERAIAETMEKKQYQWRLSRHGLDGENADDRSWLAQRLTEIADSIERTARRIKEWFEKMSERMRKRKKKSSDSSSREFSIPGLEGLGPIMSVILIVVVAGLLAWLILVLVRNFKHPPEDDHEDSGISIDMIDLEDEDIVASDLAEDEWMRLAREQISKGETRLAIRALFLASLAHLGDRGILKIARFKSNSDYRGELELRARHEVELREAFDENTGLFERVWYGLHQLGEDAVAHFMENYEKISRSNQPDESSPSEVAT